MENKIDLESSGLLDKEQSPAGVEEQLMKFVADAADMMQVLQDSLASMHVGIRILSNRVASLELYVAHLLENDPKMGPKIKEQLAKLDAEKKAETNAEETTEEKPVL